MKASAICRLPTLGLGGLFAFVLPAADPVQFVVATYLVDPPPGLVAVYTLSSPESVAEARKRVAVEGATNAGDLGLTQDTCPIFRIAPGSDGINRDVYAPGEPLWNWHIEELLDYGAQENISTIPTPAQLDEMVKDGSFMEPMDWRLRSPSTVMAEINPPFALYTYFTQPYSDQIQLYWTHDDPALDYHLEWTSSLEAPDWQRLGDQDPLASPRARKFWTILTLPFERRYFRLVTEPKGP